MSETKKKETKYFAYVGDFDPSDPYALKWEMLYKHPCIRERRNDGMNQKLKMVTIKRITWWTIMGRLALVAATPGFFMIFLFLGKKSFASFWRIAWDTWGEEIQFTDEDDPPSQ